MDFEEFLIFKNLNYNLKTNDQIIIKELKELFLEYTFYGSYPRIVLENSIEIKEYLLKQIINTYLKKDIKDLAKIGDINKFNKLLKILASQSGCLLNSLEISNTCGIARQTLENYLMILENTYIIKLITPFYRNIRSEITKMPKIYFEDLGIKHLLEKGGFPKKIQGSDLETSVYSILRKSFNSENIHFWRTTKKQEIDFVVENPQQLSVYEVKINIQNKNRLTLLNFEKHYLKSSLNLVGLNFIDQKEFKKINFIYPWQVGIKFSDL
ncbi:MAG: DUF4143 domain-containing protein [Patescibacteria group bacterium]